jgi:Ser/Thr protein kinase RdoA (MazF antagonist)
MISSVLKSYGIDSSYSLIEPIAGGLINRTWKITSGNEQYILQQINDNVFKSPLKVAKNIRMLREYAEVNSPGYLFVAPLTNQANEDIVYDNGYFRLFPFIKGSHTVDVVNSPRQAFEAAVQFGRFTRLFGGFDSSRLNITIPDFHNLSFRFRQFEDALANGNPERIRQCETLVSEVMALRTILGEFEGIVKNPLIRQRVTHHDTKISNVLFSDQDKGLCVIDLDTVMPGYFISDVGDMMRTYLSPANEEERDFTRIEVREDYFRAIVQGYLDEMAPILTNPERDLIFYSGLFMIYMQALRYLADYLNNDSYYGSRYEGHNLTRAMNQLILLKRFREKQSAFEKIIKEELEKKRVF